MENINYWAILFVLIGGLNLYLCYRFRTNEAFAIKYVKTSPKAYIWRKLFGEEKALKMIRNVFAPIGIVLGIVFVIIGAVSLFAV